MPDGVHLLELRGDERAQERVPCAADRAPPLHDVGAVRQPTPRTLIAAGFGMVIAVEDADHVTGSDLHRRVDVLGLRLTPADIEDNESRLAHRKGVERRFDRHRRGRVVRDDHFMVRRSVPEMLRDRVQDDRLFVRQIGGDDRGRPRKGPIRHGRKRRRAHGSERLDQAPGSEDSGRNTND